MEFFLKKFEHDYIGAIKKHTMPKRKTGNKTVAIHIDMGINTNILISGMSLKSYLLRNNYGENLFQVVDERQLQDIFKFAEENHKMPFWKYINKCYLEVNLGSRSTCDRSL